MEELKKAQSEKLLTKSIGAVKRNGLYDTLRKCCVVPKRYMFAILGAAACFNALAMRLCLNIAITQMVKKRSIEEMKFDPDACPSDVIVGNVTIAENIHAAFNWDEKTQGLVLSGFYYGYLTTQVYGAHLSEKYGAKWTIGLGLLSTSFFTFLTPLTIRTGGAIGLFMLRVLEGMGEGPTMPSLMVMLARWGPTHERAFLSSIIFGGGQLGNIYGSFMSGILLSDGRDWAYVFYFFGASGLLWFIFWVFLCYSEPETHPYISEEELNYLRGKITKKEYEVKGDPVPWKAILLSKPAWALLFANVGHDWGFYTMISDLPKYSHDVLKFNVTSTGLLTGLPYAAMSAGSFVFAAICDFGIKKKWHGIKTARIIYTTIAAAGPAIFIILASYCGCNRAVAMVFFIISMGLMGAYYSGMRVNTLDIAPNYAGSLTSFVNTTSTIGGMVTPYLIGLLTPESTLVQWRTAFWVCFAVLMSTNIVYCIWADGDQQWWDDIRKFGYPSSWKHGPLHRENDIEAKEGKKMKILFGKIENNVENS